ncbi:MAG: MFS transporter [Burkholderiales bacterium]|nr:MFS transporter [Burkholderiales bacterium]
MTSPSQSNDTGADPEGGLVWRLLSRIVDVRPREIATLVWSWGYIFALLSSYYVMRPIRDQMGVAGGVKNLQWLFLGTLVCMLLLNIPYGALVRALPRSRFIAITYRFFAVSIVLFAVAFRLADEAAMVWFGRAYFVWISVFNLFVVSVFWGLVVDTFGSEDGKRLFGFIAAGATIGAITGSSVTAALAKDVPVEALLITAVVLLEVAVICVRRLSRLSAALNARPHERDPEQPVGGGVLSGITHAFKSGYLANIVIFMLLFAVSSTFIYFQQADIVSRNFSDRGAQRSFFASIDLAVNVLTLIVQLGFTSRIIRGLGVARALALLPLITVAGFGALALVPTAMALMAVQVVRRSSDYAIARPTREVLYTVVPREDRYKTKSFIDTVVYRAGDQLGAWSFVLLTGAGMGVTEVAVVGAGLGMVWLINGFWLGRRQDRLAREQDEPRASVLTAPSVAQARSPAA